MLVLVVVFSLNQNLNLFQLFVELLGVFLGGMIFDFDGRPGGQSWYDQSWKRAVILNSFARAQIRLDRRNFWRSFSTRYRLQRYKRVFRWNDLIWKSVVPGIEMKGKTQNFVVKNFVREVSRQVFVLSHSPR